MKKCSNCGKVSPDNDFIGVYGKEVKSCKICREARKRSNEHRAAKRKEYYRKNADKLIAYQKEYYEKNADKIKEYKADYYIKNDGKILEYKKKYYRKNIEKIKAYLKENEDKIKRRDKKYRKDNHEIIKECQRICRAKKALYATYANRLTVDEQAESNAKGELVVRCFKCASKFVPTNRQAHDRVQALLGNKSGEHHLYCSQECKDSCSIYGVNYDPAEKDYSTSTLRNPEWSRLVKERDNFTCQKCGSTEDVQAHHVEPVALRPELSDDLDNGLTLCKRCHREVHNQDGCGLAYLRNNKVKMC